MSHEEGKQEEVVLAGEELRELADAIFNWTQYTSFERNAAVFAVMKAIFYRRKAVQSLSETDLKELMKETKEAVRVAKDEFGHLDQFEPGLIDSFEEHVLSEMEGIAEERSSPTTEVVGGEAQGEAPKVQLPSTEIGRDEMYGGPPPRSTKLDCEALEGKLAAVMKAKARLSVADSKAAAVVQVGQRLFHARSNLLEMYKVHFGDEAAGKLEQAAQAISATIESQEQVR